MFEAEKDSLFESSTSVKNFADRAYRFRKR